MKKIIIFALLLGAFFYWKGWKGSGVESMIPSQFENKTVVIEFSDGRDLLNQLRQVETGRQVESHQKPQETTYTSSGVSCDDQAGVAAFKEKIDKEQEQLRKENEQLRDEINIELKRIQQN